MSTDTNNIATIFLVPIGLREEAQTVAYNLQPPIDGGMSFALVNEFCPVNSETGEPTYVGQNALLSSDDFAKLQSFADTHAGVILARDRVRILDDGSTMIDLNDVASEYGLQIMNTLRI